SLALLFAFLCAYPLMAQKTMAPENLWQVPDVSPVGLSKDNNAIYFKVKTPDVEANQFNTTYYKLAIEGGTAQEVSKEEMDYQNKNISPDGRYKLFHKAVHVKDVLGKDIYKDLDKSDVYVINSLDYRHWDHYNDGSYNHLFYRDLEND